MRDLQLQLLQVALRRTEDLDLVRCVRDLGHAVSPTGVGHAVFAAGGDLKVCGDLGGAPLLVVLHQKPSSSLCGTFQQPFGGEKAWGHRWEQTA
jgi:hypothetical protein